MNDDPIVDEVRAAGEAYFARFRFDLQAVCDDLRKRTDQAAREGRQVVSLPSRPANPQIARPKKAC
jgi:hypothetical protein